MSKLEDRRREFRDFIWNHAADVFQAKFDQCAKLTSSEIKLLKRILSPGNRANHDRLAKAILSAVKSDRSGVRLLLQMVGLTRNKIVQDIKAYARCENLKISTSTHETLFNSDLGSRLASEYLATQLIRVFGHQKSGVTPTLLETINQATWPGFIRQERAKRMGHEAEYRIACVLNNCGLAFAPEEKIENPMCRDVIIDGMSYDLVSPSAEDARLRIISTVHTANIGQYGESKDDLEIRKAIASMKKVGDRNRVTLLAFIDGVGFESNTAGLNGVLTNADEFCQFRTIWKAVVVAAHKANRSVSVAISREDHPRFKAFCQRYRARLRDRSKIDASSSDWARAGEAMVKIT